MEPDHRPITYVEEKGVEGGSLVVYRASALGGCMAALVASRLGYTAVPPDANTLALFERGIKAEPEILAYMQENGWYIAEEQKEVEVRVNPHIVVRGHIDALGVHNDSPTTNGGRPYELVECKYMGGDSYSRWCSGGIGDFPRYAWQTSCYIHALHLATGRIGLKVEPTPGDESYVVSGPFSPPHSLGAIRRRVLKAESYVKRGEVPGCDNSFYPCPFYYLHEQKPLPMADQLLDSLIDRAITLSAHIRDKTEILNRIRTEISTWLTDRQVSSVLGQTGRATMVTPKSYDYSRMIKDHHIDKTLYAREGTPYVRINPRETDAPSQPPTDQ